MKVKSPRIAAAVLTVSCIALPALADQAQATTPPAKTGPVHTTEKTAKQGKTTTTVDQTSAPEGHATTQAGTPPETKDDKMGMGAHHSEAAASAKAGTEPVEASGASSKTTATTKPAPAVTYVCPMHPEVTSDKKDRCPKCKMFLEPKKQ